MFFERNLFPRKRFRCSDNCGPNVSQKYTFCGSTMQFQKPKGIIAWPKSILVSSKLHSFGSHSAQARPLVNYGWSFFHWKFLLCQPICMQVSILTFDGISFFNSLLILLLLPVKKTLRWISTCLYLVSMTNVIDTSLLSRKFWLNFTIKREN